MEKPRLVLVVEDDAAIRRGLCDALKFSGYAVLEASDGQAGLDLALTREVDIILLDILMPKLDGMTVLRELRRAALAAPVIFLTAKGLEEDRVRGLRSGADDYVVKPFSAQEVIARVEAVLRRSAERPKRIRRLSVAGLVIDFERREATHSDGRTIVLPEIEAQVLEYLASHPGRAIARDELLQRVWGLDPRGVQTRTVDMAVARLREHLGDDPASPRVIVTVRGKGYMLAQGVTPGTPGTSGPGTSGPGTPVGDSAAAFASDADHESSAPAPGRDA
ncbi:MAG: response regulator transcription factor [Planctomycetota bacterium]|nr:response regulator transcription factor [Planctomycetota bacterium]